MRLLLDTHSFLWFIDGSSQLSTRARQLIEDMANERFLSVASLWEIAIKTSVGKLSLGQPFAALIPHQLSINGIALLGITIRHATAVADLPLHHRDPFDRMLAAQAQVEQLLIVSGDPAFDAYGVTRLW
jgi:PIN domain nuclease of toxin-antitoxin system